MPGRRRPTRAAQAYAAAVSRLPDDEAKARAQAIADHLKPSVVRDASLIAFLHRDPSDTSLGALDVHGYRRTIQRRDYRDQLRQAIDRDASVARMLLINHPQRDDRGKPALL